MTGPRVLVVEDEPRIAQFLAKGLTRGGFEVVVAEDGEVGLFLALTEPLAAVVLDVTLPGRSGLELLTELRRTDARLPVVMLTGHDDPAARRACLDAGASGFVAKPLVFATLLAEVQRLVSGAA